jgi:hypothetical protein
MNVYLNGEPDDGLLLGSVTGMQRSSRQPLFIGKRSDRQGSEFAGSIDDVRVYSFALTKSQVAEVLRGRSVDNPTATKLPGPSIRNPVGMPECDWSSDPADARLPRVVGMVGVFVALACIGLFPGRPLLLGVAMSFVAGVLLLAISSPTLPRVNLLLVPLTSVAGGISVAMSVRDESDDLTPLGSPDRRT